MGSTKALIRVLACLASGLAGFSKDVVTALGDFFMSAEYGALKKLDKLGCRIKACQVSVLRWETDL